MIKSVLVAVHQTPAADPSMAFAARIAHACEASLRGVYVADPGRFVYVPLLTRLTAPLTGDMPRGVPRPPNELLAEEQRQEDEGRVLKESFAKVCQAEGLSGEFEVLSGPVENMVLSRSRTVDCLVLGHRSRMDYDDTMIGRVMRKAGRPVVVVSDSVPTGPILFAYDGSIASQRSMAVGAELLWRGAFESAHVLALAKDPDAAGVLQQEAGEYLEPYSSKVTLLADFGESAQSILASAKAMGAGLIVMGAHDDGTVREALFGSLVAAVLKEAFCPALTVY